MLNTITVMGRLTADVDKKTTQSGVSVANFTIAVDRDYRNGDERVADFIPVCVWRGLADFCEKHLSKGRMVVVSGQLQSRKWEDRDGNKRTSWEIQAQNIYFADSRRDGAVPGGTEHSAGPAPNIAEDYGQDDPNLPF